MGRCGWQSWDFQPQQMMWPVILLYLYFSWAPDLGSIKVGLNLGVGERFTNGLLLLSDEAVPVE